MKMTSSFFVSNKALTNQKECKLDAHWRLAFFNIAHEHELTTATQVLKLLKHFVLRKYLVHRLLNKYLKVFGTHVSKIFSTSEVFNMRAAKTFSTYEYLVHRITSVQRIILTQTLSKMNKIIFLIFLVTSNYQLQGNLSSL